MISHILSDQNGMKQKIHIKGIFKNNENSFRQNNSNFILYLCLDPKLACILL